MGTSKIVEGNIYVLSDGTPYYFKIGKTIKPVELRVKQLQTGNKQRITIVYQMRFNDMNKAESSLHRIFAAYRRSGEWFQLDRQARALLGKIFKDSLYPINSDDENRLKGFGLR